MTNTRSSVVIPEKKEKIENIKKKYNKMSMSDSTASKIEKLEITNNILKTADIGAGIVTFIDIVTLDPAPLIDEAVLTGVTTLLSTSSKIIENKINNLVESDKINLQMEEATIIGKQISDIASAVKAKTGSIKR